MNPSPKPASLRSRVQPGPRGTLTLVLLALVVTLLASACATTQPTVLYAMPEDPDRAIAPRDADPYHAGELAEGALHLLDPDLPGGPDYAGAARMCLVAADTAHPVSERGLRMACYRLAARSALRAADRSLYVEAVGLWDDHASRAERTSGELAIHMAIRDRLRGEEPGRRIPAELARLLPAAREPGEPAHARGAVGR